MSGATITIVAFLLTILFIFWRPKGVNEAIPACGGAILVLISGSVSFADLTVIAETVSGAAVTIVATIVMAIVLESFGFFQWVAVQLFHLAKGSGIRLFWYVNLLCFLMTLFFNNDGSILITTPILIILLTRLQLKNHQKIPYLLSGALIATASSAPIGVSNIVNLIALKIVHMDLYMHTLMMFVPATLGLLLLVFLLFAYFYRDLPRKLKTQVEINSSYEKIVDHPLKHSVKEAPFQNDSSFMVKVLFFVFSIRVGLFIASYFAIPVSLVAIAGSVALLAWRWIYLGISPGDMLKKTPWHILVFAFCMYIIIYGLNNIGLTRWLVAYFQPIVSGDLLYASVIMGVLISVMSNIFNNHPALMIGTLTLTNLGLDPLALKVSYLANVIGSDMGSLLLPIGTLASLIWMHILKESKIRISWSDYIKVTARVIPPSLLFTLIILYYWVSWLFY